MSEHANPSGVVVADPAVENMLLRAALAEAQQRIRELEQRTDQDPLTGLANGRRFNAELERVVELVQRHATPAALVSIDLRGFARINEAHGRLAGDSALVHVAGLVSGLIRGSDLLARVGGDEFALILDHLDHNSAIETADRLARCIAVNPLDLGGGVQVALEAAVATTFIMKGDSAPEILVRAGRNLAVAKSNG